MPRRTVYEKKANLVGTASSLHPTKQTKSNEHKSNAHTTGTGAAVTQRLLRLPLCLLAKYTHDYSLSTY